MDIITEKGIIQVSWDMIEEDFNTVGVPLEPVWGIVASQDCDAARVPYLTFFKIDTLQKVSGFSLPDEEKAKSWVSIISQKSRLNAHWFYLTKIQQYWIFRKNGCKFSYNFFASTRISRNENSYSTQRTIE